MGEERSGLEGTDDDSDSRYHHLIAHIQDAVVEFEVVDGEAIVRTVNNAFVEIFGYEPDQIRGDSLNEWIVPDWRVDEARRLDERIASGDVNYQRVSRETSTGLREFLYRGIPYGDSARTDGIAIYTDLTEISRKQRRLKVMNRVLRHNIRNNANIITGHMTRLRTEIDTDATAAASVAATIESAAHELERLSEEAANIQRVLQGPPSDDSRIDCVSVVQSVAREHRKRSSRAEITSELPESLEVKADSRLRFAIDSLVDNAVRHNPSRSPRVRIRVEEDDRTDWVTIHIDDDGPQIPLDERNVITGTREITATQHGSGLGLWLAKWTVELFGGDLSFATSEFGGNDVSIRLLGP